MNPTLRHGSRGTAVKTLQRALNRLLSPSPDLVTDGIFGPLTEKAVIRYQRACNFQNPAFGVDGVVGGQTWGAIDSGKAPPDAPSPPPSPGHSWADQYASRFSKHGIPGYKGLVSQIHFPTGVATLDANDQKVLYDLCDSYQYYLMKHPVQLFMVGYADPRGTKEYNEALGGQRAAAVKTFIDGRLARWRRFRSRAGTGGELYPSGDWAADRRTDIYSTYIPTGRPMNFPPMKFKGTYGGPMTKRFEVRVIIGAGVDVYGAGGQVITIEIRNKRTGRTAMYTYSGASMGMGVGVSRPTGWTEQVTPDYMDVDDFAGRGDVTSISYGFESGTVFVFDGPKTRGKTAEPVMWRFEGWDLNIGVSGPVPEVRGEWHRR